MTHKLDAKLFLIFILQFLLFLSSCMPNDSKYSMEPVPPVFKQKQFVINDILYSFNSYLTQNRMPQIRLESDVKPECRPIRVSVSLSTTADKIPQNINIKDVNVKNNNNKWSGSISFNEDRTKQSDYKITKTAESCDLSIENIPATLVKITIVDLAGNVYYAQTTAKLSTVY